MSKDEALRLALEGFEKIKHHFDTDEYAYEIAVKSITAIKQALEQPEQEPVAWRNAALRVGEDLCSVGPFGYYDMTAEQWLDWALSVVTVHAPPPKREWQELTDEEIVELRGGYQSGQIGSFVALCRATEAKLKEKNT